MKEFPIVMSIAGHDIGRIYVVVGEREGKLLLCDGKRKTLDNPKCKSKKHLKEIGKTDLSAYKPLYDAHVRNALKGVNLEDICL